MFIPPLRETHRSIQSVLKKVVSDGPVYSAIDSMKNLKRRRGSPSSSGDSPGQQQTKQQQQPTSSLLPPATIPPSTSPLLLPFTASPHPPYDFTALSQPFPNIQQRLSPLHRAPKRMRAMSERRQLNENQHGQSPHRRSPEQYEEDEQSQYHTTTGPSSYGIYTPVTTASYTQALGMPGNFSASMSPPHLPSPMVGMVTSTQSSGYPVSAIGTSVALPSIPYPTSMSPSNYPSAYTGSVQEDGGFVITESESVEDDQKRRRKQQNRDAQKAFRDRQRKAHEGLQTENQQLKTELDNIKADKEVLTQKLNQALYEIERLRRTSK